MALSGIDMARWDALARASNLSLARLTGGVEKGIVAYGAVGFEGPSGSAAGAEAWAKRGHPSAEQDLDVIRAIRNAVDPGVAIMVDYNQSLTPVDAIAREIRTPIQCGENWCGVLASSMESTRTLRIT